MYSKSWFRRLYFELRNDNFKASVLFPLNGNTMAITVFNFERRSRTHEHHCYVLELAVTEQTTRPLLSWVQTNKEYFNLYRLITKIENFCQKRSDESSHIVREVFKRYRFVYLVAAETNCCTLSDNDQPETYISALLFFVICIYAVYNTSIGIPLSSSFGATWTRKLEDKLLSTNMKLLQ